ncbi:MULTISPECIES: sensor histidine kinase [unclassified Lentimicrobium]|uniref:sensor histidine kinase n=1 Tax=unclassified Lentimicrobium TaxID=2677434 RepID=UPI001556E58F|nr:MULTISPECIES: histidine kinase [unclassified Lentimicrobium]NPD47661.1 histidine kinase [Lentimicrobium sp. S6]NPD86615.1 histidine kinase [Lentimicrobium sp. L6]
MKEGIKLNKTLRYGYGLVLGIAFNFNMDIVFSLLYSNYRLLRPFEEYVAAIFLSYLVFETLFIVNRFLSRRFTWDKDLIKRLSYQSLLDFMIAIGLVMGIKWGFRWVQQDNSFVSLQDETTQSIVILIIILGFTVGEMSIFLLNKWRFSLAELERFKKKNAEYRFELLRSQLNPHFLFNSLNTLSSLVYKNQENASLFIRKLSDVYRYILDQRDKEVVPLETEINFAASYIMLMQLRFEKNLNVNLEAMKLAEKYLIAPLTLQLLIENAIKHNIVSKSKPLQIDIFTAGGYLWVKNNMQPKTYKEDSHEMGLKNIDSRYAFLTDKKIEIENDGITFMVKIPLLNTVK